MKLNILNLFFGLIAVVLIYLYWDIKEETRINSSRFIRQIENIQNQIDSLNLNLGSKVAGQKVLSKFSSFGIATEDIDEEILRKYNVESSTKSKYFFCAFEVYSFYNGGEHDDFILSDISETNLKDKSVYQNADNLEKQLNQEIEMGIAPKCRIEKRWILTFKSYDEASKIRQIFLNKTD